MPRMSDFEVQMTTLTQTIYEAIVDPRLWELFTNQAGAVIGASASALAIRRRDGLAVVDPVAASWDERAGREYLEHFHDADIVTPRLAEVSPSTPFILEELWEPSLFERTPFFNDWANKHSVAYLAGVTFDIDREHIGALSFHRERRWDKLAEQQFEFIRRIAVPLRFALGQRRLTRELSAARGSLERLSIGVVQLDEIGRVAWCNSKAEQLLTLGDGLTVRNRALRATTHEVNARLEELINDTVQGWTSPRGATMVVPRSGQRTALHVVVIPLSRQGIQSVTGEYVPTALFVNDMDDPEYYEVVLREMWKLAFDLTDIQAGIACQLVDGAKYKEMVTPERNQETVRSHIKAIYAKTGVGTRAELQKLARRMVMPLRLRRNRANQS